MVAMSSFRLAYNVTADIRGGKSKPQISSPTTNIYFLTTLSLTTQLAIFYIRLLGVVACVEATALMATESGKKFAL
jgi:hypothetical protein